MSAPLIRLPNRRADPPANTGPLGRPLRLVTSSDDREFLPAALELIETPASPRRIAFIWIACAMLASAVAWSCFAKLDIFAVAPGRLQVIGRSKIIQSLDPGKVSAILVANGTRVTAGQTLITLDPTDADADRARALSDLQAAEAEIVRRRAEIAAVLSGSAAVTRVTFPQNVGPAARMLAQKVLIAELSQYLSSVKRYRAKLAESAAAKERLVSTIAARQHVRAVLQNVLQMRRQLMAKQVGSRLAVLQAEQQLDQVLTEMSSDTGKLQEAEAAILSTKREINQLQKQFVAEQADKLATAVRERNDVEQELIKAAAKVRRTRLRAPISGTVQQLAVTTIGQVVTPGQPLLVIVPNHAKMEVEALVASSDFGFVKIGQKAVVKLAAFPFNRYGTIKGKVVRLSRDSVYDKDIAMGDAATLPQSNASLLSTTPQTQNLVYPVWVDMIRDWVSVHGKHVLLRPGMTATIEIRTGRRSVIDYLLSPLRRMASQAGHER